METEMNQWLKCRYRGATASGLESKRVKFSDLLDEAKTELSPLVSNISLARAIRDEFPGSVSRKVGDQRLTYIYGLERDTTDTTADLQSSLAAAQARNDQLEREVAQLKKKLAEQEAATTKRLTGQMQSLVSPGLMVHHGPDTVPHLHSFSIQSILEEFSGHAPDVLDLLKQLGNCGRFDDDDSVHIATLRSVTALSTLLKCRSAKVLGLQLLLSIMLIARATNKQVGT